MSFTAQQKLWDILERLSDSQNTNVLHSQHFTDFTVTETTMEFYFNMHAGTVGGAVFVLPINDSFENWCMTAVY